MDRGEPNKPPTAPEPIDGGTKRSSARRLVWLGMLLAIVVPGLVVLILIVVGPGLSTESQAIVGTWSPANTFDIFEVTLREDGSGRARWCNSTSSDEFSWSFDGDRLETWRTPGSYWLRLWYRCGGRPERVDLYHVQLISEDRAMVDVQGGPYGFPPRQRPARSSG